MQLITTQPSAIYSGVVNAVSRISSHEGATALWRGVNSVLLGAGPAHALSFALYEQCKSMFRDSDDEGHQILADGILSLNKWWWWKMMAYIFLEK
jgi:solute carrier family 25 iron transporter 28/37